MNALRCAGWLAVAGFLALVARFWHPVFGFTQFLQLDAANAAVAIDAFHEFPVYVYRDAGPYDGQIYAQIAHDPTLRDSQLRRSVDDLVYRGRRILAPALAWALAGGQPLRIARIYSVLNVAAWLILAALLWTGLPVTDARGFVGWAGVLFSAGAIACVRLALTDLIGATFLFAGILQAERRRGRSAVVLTALGGLARETSLLGVAGLWDAVAGPTVAGRADPGTCDVATKSAGVNGPRDSDVPSTSACVNAPGCGGVASPSAGVGAPGYNLTLRWTKNLGRTVLAALPLGLWIAYIRFQVGPGDAGWGNFTWPVSGWIGKWVESMSALGTQGDHWLSATTLLAVVGLSAQWIWFVCHWSPADRWWRMGAPYALLLLLLGKAVWEDFPGAAFRTLLPLTLAFNLLAVRRRTAWAWLLIGNLTVFSGLLALRDVPSDNREVGAAVSRGEACLVCTGPGWFGTEKNHRHRWTWSSGAPSVLNFQVWPALSGEVRCEAYLVSLAPGHVAVCESTRLSHESTRLSHEGVREGTRLSDEGREGTRLSHEGDRLSDEGARLSREHEGDRLLWAGSVGRKKIAVNFTVEVRNGRGQVVFITDAPAVPEAAGAGARRLAVALYDLKVTIPDVQARSP